MKHLFMVRHGKYDSETGKLTDCGRTQIHELVRQMKEICGNLENFCLLSSTAPRAEETAYIIADAFGLESFDRDARLFNEEDELTERETELIDNMIAPHRAADNGIVVATHYSVVKSYSEYLLENEFGIRDEVIEPESGEAVHFDLLAKTFQILPG